MTDHPRDDLAAYALGTLDTAEQRMVGAHLDSCATCREELDALEEAAWALAETAAAPAPARLRERIVSRERAPRGRLGALFGGLRAPVPLAIPLALALALIVALVGLGSARRDADTYTRAVAAVVGARLVALSDTGEAPGARGTLVVPVDPGASAPYLILELPSAPAGHAWEAWVVRGDRAIPAGLVEDRAGVLTVALTEAPAAGDQVAVTLERSGGASQPTTRPVLAGRV
ncbi:MAG: anti-sigma factor [Chloroflexi bacterium]|nr:anti-sigma factor [Chloroflexota bacterium]